MSGVSRQKQKLLILEQLFKKRTDENHPLTGNQIIQYLNNNDIKAERKTIYDDIATLTGSGLPVETKKIGHSNAYFIEKRVFEDVELFLLADAVASSKFLTIKKSNDLIEKLQKLTSDYKAKQLRRSIHVENRTKSFNDFIYYNINEIQSAIFSDRNISFNYFEYDMQKKKQLKHGGQTYVVSPFQLICENNNYYLTCYCHNHKKICRYRVDRMKNVSVEDEKRQKLTEDEEQELKNLRSVYNMYGGQIENVQIQFDNKLINVVIDRFGERVICHPNSDNTFFINVEVQISPTFWGWLFQFGKDAKILSPSKIADMAKDKLKETSELYK